MGRNIILCADGTGNKGGFTPDSNVFKTYQAADIKEAAPSESAQISYYDNGVGTSANKLWKGLTGAFGVGFQRNITELYTFLSKNYRTGDKVFMFGFSRGAAAIRALNGLIHDCGVIDAAAYDSEQDLKKEVQTLVKAYLRARCRGADTLRGSVDGCPSPRVAIKIEFIGVWDTVAALGMPKRTDVTEIISGIMNKLFEGADKLLNIFFCHREYNFQLTPNIEFARHALSIDDARTSFWPRIWKEVDESTSHVDVEQVWFAGMHSDVGGGYERQDMSNVPLLWILEWAVKSGLRLNDDVIDSVQDRANVHDKIHDSRSGTGIFYRYHPRDIEQLCRNENRKEDPKMLKAIRIHKSVLSRMYHGTAGYAPILLPPQFEVTDNKGSVPAGDDNQTITVDVTKHEDWIALRGRMQHSIKMLKEMYVYQMVTAATVLISCAVLWNQSVDMQERSGVAGNIADTLGYILPAMFANAIELWVYQRPEYFMSLLALVLFWWMARSFIRASVTANAIAQRRIILASAEGSVDIGSPDPVSMAASERRRYILGVLTLIPFGLAFYAGLGFVVYRASILIMNCMGS